MFLIEWQHFHTEIGKFSHDFMTWRKYAILGGVHILHFPGTLWKTDSTIWCSTLSLARSSKSENQLRQKICDSNHIHLHGGYYNQADHCGDRKGLGRRFLCMADQPAVVWALLLFCVKFCGRSQWHLVMTDVMAVASLKWVWGGGEGGSETMILSDWIYFYFC